MIATLLPRKYGGTEKDRKALKASNTAPPCAGADKTTLQLKELGVSEIMQLGSNFLTMNPIGSQPTTLGIKTITTVKDL